MPDRSTSFTPPGDTAWVYDPQHEALRFVSNANGMLYTYDLAQQAFAAPLSIGGSPDSIAISPDGQTLIIGNAGLAGTPTEITRVNLSTHAVDQVSTVLPNPAEAAHVAVDANGVAIFGVSSAVLGGNTFYGFQAGANAPVAAPYAGLAPLADRGFGASSYLLSSPDHRFILVEDPTSGPSQIGLYDTAFHAVVGRAGEGGPFRIYGFQEGSGDVSDSGFVVDVTPEAALVMDSQLNLIKDLKTITGGIAGAAFSPDGRDLFIWVPGNGAVYALDTQSWSVVGTLNATLDAHAMGAGLISSHNVQVIAGGGLLALNDHSSVELIDLSSLHLSAGPPAGSSDPVFPIDTTGPPELASAQVSGDMDALQLSDLLHATVTRADATGFAAAAPGGTAVHLSGADLVYADNQLTGGVITHVDVTDIQPGATVTFSVDAEPGEAWSAAQFETWLINNDAAGAYQTLLGQGALIRGGTGSDLIHSYGSGAVIEGLGGSDTVLAGAGNDVIYAGASPQTTATIGAAGATYLRGGAGDDYIVGGAGFDDINGNTGADSLNGGDGNDWVLGGQGDDMVFGGAGDDILNGNIGRDTCVGGPGADTVRGGQGDDMIYGGDGNDWLSGDLGNNTLTGGEGADTFHASAGADVVTDFSEADGDRVQVDLGVTYQTSQIGADVHVDLSNGGHLVLQNVQLSSLPAGWIFAM